MIDDPDEENLVRVATAPTEAQASMILSALKSEGITATLGGAQAAQMMPGVFEEVEVLVRDVDFPHAARLIEQIGDEELKIDWSHVDVGRPEERGESDEEE